MRTIKLVGIVAFVAACCMSLIPANTTALSGTDFKPGRIIDDQLFFNGGDMSTEQIQIFLNGKVPVCDTNGAKDSTQWNASAGRYYTRAEYGAQRGQPAPYTCLKDYTQQTEARAAEAGLCTALAGGQRSAAQIIRDVGQACGINPKVLLVLLQKEQSLVTDEWPWERQYRAATGFGCPDTAACDANYAGFFNQVYSAARIFKRYATNPNSYNYKANTTNYIRYNPNANCGGSSVFIENQATAGLYIYTPYQPNQSSLDNLYGSGDSCGAYGNRNFWRFYNEWFGSTLAPDPQPPVAPTFGYLREYLASLDKVQGRYTVNTKGFVGQVSEAEKKYQADKPAKAEQLLQKTAKAVQDLVPQGRITQQQATDYATAVQALIDSWKQPEQPTEPEEPTPVANGGYPYAAIPIDSMVDPWGYYVRQSTSYAAFKVYQAGGNPLRYAGNPKQWPARAQAAGIPVDATPRKGDVAVSMTGTYGHAMYVEEILADGSILVSQYNRTWQGEYSEMTIAPSNFTNLQFIHFQP
ncbi:MAG TPA: CHAP domain-containing protein [Candidatus Saccharimonadales bacterium]|nr:CHAP domain-containing protein [Candidatus Saccharimonadales bacterium]